MIIFLASCKYNSETEINNLIKSNNPDELVQGFFLIGEQKRKEYVHLILSNVNDPRISHTLRFKGVSVYQSKIIAMKKISGELPPGKITYKPDSVVIKFYKEWALKHKLL